MVLMDFNNMANKTIEADTKQCRYINVTRPCMHTHELGFGYNNEICILCYIMIVGLYSHIS